MNMNAVNIAGCGPAAWNRGGIPSPISVNIHTKTHPADKHRTHVNPDTRAMADARGELHEHHWPIGLEH